MAYKGFLLPGDGIASAIGQSLKLKVRYDVRYMQISESSDHILAHWQIGCRIHPLGF